MWNTKKKRMFTSDCIHNLDFVFIARSVDPGNGNVDVVMTSITEEEETLLDKGKTIVIKRGNVEFTINSNLCFAYGELDLSPNSDTIKLFAEIDWFRNLYIKHFLFSEYDYKHHTITSDVKGGRWYDTSNISKYLPYLYACLNKPKRIVIFRQTFYMKSIYKNKQKEYYQKNKAKRDEVSAKSRINISKNKRKAKLSTLKFDIW